MRSRPPPSRPLSAAFDPTSRDARPRSKGMQDRLPASPYDQNLLPATLAWLRALPEAACPRELAAWAPRIPNRIARYWDSPQMMESIFDDLLADRRGGRKGFPAKVAAELRALHAHYRSLNASALKPPVDAEKRQPAPASDRTLNASAIRWLADLPDRVRPNQSALRFPRIVNRLARFWDTPAMVTEIFNELLIDSRPARDGFPADVLHELRLLQTFWQTARPASVASDLWSSVPERGIKKI